MPTRLYAENNPAELTRRICAINKAARLTFNTAIESSSIVVAVGGKRITIAGANLAEATAKAFRDPALLKFITGKNEKHTNSLKR